MYFFLSILTNIVLPVEEGTNCKCPEHQRKGKGKGKGTFLWREAKLGELLEDLKA